MTLLLNCNDLEKAHGARVLFKGVSFGISKNDKIGLIGPNGAGKSTLLRILSGEDSADSGTLAAKKYLRTSLVPQISSYPSDPILDVIVNAISKDNHNPQHVRLSQAETILSKLGFTDFYQNAHALSGGWKKRLDLAKALINAPELLLLDEPTNHLDVEGIQWLGNFLKKENSLAFVVTSHDRYFLQKVATKMIELNPHYPNGIFACDGSYEEFLVKREEFLNYQLECEQALKTKSGSEQEWLRRSPKARTTKSRARIQEAGRLLDELTELRSRNKRSTAKIDFETSDRQTKKLLVAKNISKKMGDRLLFSHLDLTLTPGLRLGIVGANGTGKTTLLKVLAGQLEPDQGTIKSADDLKIVYFDQHRQLLRDDISLKEALCPNGDTVFYRGKNIHVNSWAKRFLFEPWRLTLPIKQLSGGERARIGIAKLMLQPADLLFLDEPTNDLDIETLETLEESLSEFPGAVVLITHDLALLDGVTNAILGLGILGENPLLADYSQWEDFVQERQIKAVEPLPELKAAPKPKEATAPKKLSWAEQKEMEQMESAILKVEAEMTELENQAEAYSASQSDNIHELQEIYRKLGEAQEKLDQLFHRWQELETRK